jgi:hypothetical protein
VCVCMCVCFIDEYKNKAFYGVPEGTHNPTNSTITADPTHSSSLLALLTLLALLPQITSVPIALSTLKHTGIAYSQTPGAAVEEVTPAETRRLAR